MRAGPHASRPLVRDRGLFARILRLFVARSTLAEGAEVLAAALREHPSLVVVLNHGPAHAPLLPLAALGLAILDEGGGERRMLGVTFRGLYAVPGLRQLAARLTQASSPPSFDALVRALESGRCTDVVIMPEGQNCVVGDPSELKPFASPRFVELALRTGRPVLLAVHHGTERWARRVGIPSRVPVHRVASLVSESLGHEVRRHGALALPVGVGRIPELRLGFALHRPGLSPSELEALAPEERARRIADEAETIHAAMRALHARLGASGPS
ncbi:MAG: hypothetical protein U0230_12145 [Polyangiales bacterium]